MDKKKSYERPQIKKVELTPDEAVLSFCKADTGANRRAGRCTAEATCLNKTPGS